mgnify:CR=1 FL=1
MVFLLTQFFLNFISPENLKFQSFSGYVTRGIFFDLIKSVDEALAEKLHSNKGISPYSLTPVEIFSNGGMRFVYRRCEAPVRGRFRITAMRDDLSSVLKEAIISRDSINFVDRKAIITEISVREFNFHGFLENARPVRKFSVLFRTPCYFRLLPTKEGRRKGQYRAYPLPDPALLLRSALRLWTNFSDAKFNYEKFLEWVNEGGVSISGFPKGIRTVRVYEHPTTNKWNIGFVGEVRYSIPDDSYDPKFSSIVDALMSFSEISNVGGNRTAGFGVVEYRRADQCSSSQG